MNHRARQVLVGMLGIGLWALFPPSSLPTVRFLTNTTTGWGSITAPSTPAGLNSWDNPSSSDTSNDSTAVYTVLMNWNTTPIITAVSAGSLTHSTHIPADTLETTYKFVAETYNTSGTVSGGIDPAANYSAQGQNVFVAPSAFLSAGITFYPDTTYIFGFLRFHDDDALLTITSRGRNPASQDPAIPDDNTEAPDEGVYTANVILRMTY